jgi:hypothetical protein
MWPPYFMRAAAIWATSVLLGTIMVVYIPAGATLLGYEELAFFMLAFSAIFSTPVVPFLVAGFNFLENKSWSLAAKRSSLAFYSIVLAFGALMLGLSIVGMSAIVWEFLRAYGGAAVLSILVLTIRYPKKNKNATANERT